jgi:hypothetical protein
MEYIIGAYLAYRGTHRRVSEPTWLTEEHGGEYLSLPGVQRNGQESKSEPNLAYRGTHRIVSEPKKPSLLFCYAEKQTREYTILA